MFLTTPYQNCIQLQQNLLAHEDKARSNIVPWLWCDLLK